jgi:4-amino-4-deoxy-L-arabinose transferase-like glycosyltransferase
MSAPRSPSGDLAPPGPATPPSGEPRDRAPPWPLIGLVVAILALRLAAASAFHLTEDEAYYRLWSMSPALGYYDHPPMIAWWIALGRALAGDTPLGVRLLPALSCALSSLLIFDLARLAGADRRTAMRAAVWFNAMLLVAAGGFLAVPDAPAALFWTLTLWCALKACASPSKSAAWWLAAGVAAGLAALSKYSALFLGPGILLWLASTNAGRARLREPGPWLALLAAAALFSLNIAWNAGHHWLTFAKQFGRIAPYRLAPRYLVEFLAVQAILLNPLIAVFVGRAASGGRDGTAARPQLGIFVATSAPFVGYLILHSLHDRVQAHWPAPVYPAAAIIAAFAAAGADGRKGWIALRAAVPLLALAVIAALLAYLALSPRLPNSFADPALAVRGWPSFAARLDTLRASRGAAWVGTSSYGLAAELADESAIRAPILQVSERARWQGLALGPAPNLTRPGLVVDLPRRIDAAALRGCFARVLALGPLDRLAPGGQATRYAAFEVSMPTRDVSRRGCRP